MVERRRATRQFKYAHQAHQVFTPTRVRMHTDWAPCSPVRSRSGSQFSSRCAKKEMIGCRRLLLKEVDLDDANAGCLILTSHLCGVLPGLDRHHDGRLKVVGRLEAGVLEFLLLVCFPIIIL
jgi:hypothetical protein